MKMVARIYVDTSVFGGVFDLEFEHPSKIFFELAQKNKFSLCISPVVLFELENSPEKVSKFFSAHTDLFEILEPDDSSLRLQTEYLRHGVLTEKSENDALHIAIASVHNCNIIVSWNFKHIVNWKRIPFFNAINVEQGHSTIQIYSPWEVIGDEI